MKKSWQEPTINFVKTNDADVILASFQETGVDAGGWFTDGGDTE